MLLPSQPHLPPPPARSPVSLPWERRCEHRGGAHQGAWFVHPAAPLQLSPWQLRTQSARVRVLYSKGTDSRRKAEFGGGGEKKKIHTAWFRHCEWLGTWNRVFKASTWGFDGTSESCLAPDCRGVASVLVSHRRLRNCRMALSACPLSQVKVLTQHRRLNLKGEPR